MSSLIEKLDIYGAAVNSAMERFMGDEELYIDCVTQFKNDENFEQLKAALEAEDYSSAFRFAHAIKGVCANLGLSPLFKAVAELVEPLRNGVGDGVDELYKTFVEEYQNFIKVMED